MTLTGKRSEDGGYAIVDDGSNLIYTLCIDFVLSYPKNVEVPPVDNADTPGLVWVLRTPTGKYVDHHEDKLELANRNKIKLPPSDV